MILSHFQPFANHHPSENTKIVTNQYIQNNVVPPTLIKVGKKVTKENFSQFPHYGNAPANAIVPYYECLHTPAPVMSKGKPRNDKIPMKA